MNRNVYAHPDGHRLDYNNNALIATDDEGRAVRLPIGPDGLASLADSLNELAADTGLRAEQDGRFAAIACLKALPSACDQEERIGVLRHYLEGISKTSHPERAAAGFASVLASVVASGLESLK